MNELDQAGLARLRDGWISGGAMFEFAPVEWKEVATAFSPDEQERRLLAIAGQALDVALRPAAPKSLKRRPPLPVLALPMLPERLRPLLRAALKYAADARLKTRVATLVASRGFVTHPMDWMPAASDQNGPEVYAPWVDWQAGADGEKQLRREHLTAETWDDFYPAARRSALIDLRRSAPALARALIETKGASEPAEVRLALIELMRFGLGADDVPFLKSLSADRSGKVREMAGRLLARLGERSITEGQTEDPAIELSAFIEEGKSGFIRRRSTYAPIKPKSQAQQARRADLFATCYFGDLVGHFGKTESDFIGAWQFGVDDGADLFLVRMVAASGGDAAVASLADLLAAAGGRLAILGLQLTARLDSGRKRVLIRQILNDAQNLAALNMVEGAEAGWLEWGDLAKGKTLSALRSAVSGDNDVVKRNAEQYLEAIGFLASPATAEKLISEVVAAGLPPASPSLSLLRLNAALGGNPTR
ncbi:MULTISPECIES: DUF5691 domain-containing protein [unclassified Mesorhizobium]|uniref:DUF5691 domain-containing protein n=5 Tax=Mesorhizobium TaxID=68287 RepID=UPI000F755A93|nr:MULTISPECIES: DUF5691 domain-containing protein [unclassified Mesorhizobium]AZO05804.1 hypothetical protein EJ068_24120 [Mesorhizobium sp. M2A.F.Ca.ET.043.02.1.1]AZO33814.1 hypothetical protein EJ072_04225 [Mesorhizobium sp. M2A.F.Ca.ET.046.03.2.1]RUW39689.1 hypothetical protein EOA37_18570 [Mesorhizobium sp. M2A.F.Ca.ET.015.02.1.1]RVC93919.1 hypothetical protein EN739_19370 [Mesorhizobium sp. M2A.F.Ca.ET.017.03.2.1]RWB47230.1 MAG: hypothetical protein EOQ44_08835 [Mesorhizobium sp.]